MPRTLVCSAKSSPLFLQRMASEKDHAAPSLPRWWCAPCAKDLQSAAAFAEHCDGRRHLRLAALYSIANGPADAPVCHAPKSRPQPRPVMTEIELFEGLADGRFTSVVICTGAGVSTAAGARDFRSQGGFYDEVRSRFALQHPELHGAPELLLNRQFQAQHPELHDAAKQWLRERKSGFADLQPTATHRLGPWLAQRGWLRRIYTQNVDGLDLHPSLGVDPEKVPPVTSSHPAVP